MPSLQPFVSVILPCRNEETAIRRCLHSVLASDYPTDRLEVLVADGESTDTTPSILREVAAKDARVRVLKNPGRITPLGLNLALAASRGELILRVDAHSVISPSYLPTLVEFLGAHPTAWGAGGRMETEAESDGWFVEAVPLVLSHKFGVGNSQFRTERAALEPQRADTVFNCCWRREVFRRVGLFHEKLARSQDIELSSRIRAAGGELWWVPGAQTTYYARVRFGAFLRHNWGNGIWSVLPAAFLGYSPVRWRHLIPLAFVSALTVSTLAAIIFPFAFWLPAAPAGAYLGVNFAVSWHAAIQKRTASLAALLPIAFAVLHLAYGAGSLWGACQFAVYRLAGTARTPHSPRLTTL